MIWGDRLKKLHQLLAAVLMILFFSGCQLSDLPSLFGDSSGVSRSNSGTSVVESPPPVSGGQPSGSQTGEGDEMRAVWITQFELNTIRSLSDFSFRSSFAAMMKNCADFGLNTVFVQVRPNGDAFYPSSVYPWTVYASGTAGTAVSYDPLAVMIEEAHRYGLKFHAWFNPYRLQPEKQMQSIPASFQTRKWYDERSSSDRVVVLNGTCYLNPGYPEARQLIQDGVKEIVSRYNVDGLHIDDYFYPTTDESFDSTAYAANGGEKSLNDFRFDNVDQTIRGIYSTIKSVKSTVAFGVSPAGNMSNNTSKLYADTKKWTSDSGYLDYIIPQLYWNYDHPTAPFSSTVVSWNDTVSASGVKFVPGLAPYKIDAGEWSDCGSILAQMVTDSRNQSNYGGVAFYSYTAMFQSKTDDMRKEMESLSKVFE